jgi:hypothetical protein
MKAALLSFALLSGQPTLPISDSVPKLNVEATCREMVATNKAMDLAESESFKNCMRDEATAQQQLGMLWSRTPPSVRSSCEGEATTGGFDSYVDMLTCIQMAGIGNLETASQTSLIGGSKKYRNLKK